MCLGQLAASYKSVVLAHLSGIVPSRSKSAEEMGENRNQLKLAGFKYELTNNERQHNFWVHHQLSALAGDEKNSI